MPSSFYAYRSICNALGASLVQILDLDEVGTAGDTCVRACRNDDLVASSCQVRSVRHCDCGAKDVVDTLELLGDHRDDAEVQRKTTLNQVAWRESKDGSVRAAARHQDRRPARLCRTDDELGSDNLSRADSGVSDRIRRVRCRRGIAGFHSGPVHLASLGRLDDATPSSRRFPRETCRLPSRC